jgi:hypothetical protein
VISRRHLLAATAGLLTGSPGCLTAAGLAETGFLAYKVVEVAWERDGRPVSANLGWVWSDGVTRIFGWYPEEYPELATPTGDLRVSDAVAERLRRDFREVTFGLGFSRPGATGRGLREHDWYVAHASRRDFNRVGFGDRAEVAFGDRRVRVVDVYEGAQGDPGEWERTVRPMDFSEAYRDRGVPVGAATR